MEAAPARNSAAHKTFSTVAQPGAIVSNAWPFSRDTEGATLEAIRQVLERHPFFEAIQTVDIPYAAERRGVRKIVADQGHPHTYTLTRVLAEKQVTLSSLDPAKRRLACEIVIGCLGDAAECGARYVCVISGGRPEDPARRSEAIRVLEDSLTQICAAAAQYPGMEILIEPLDCEAHKKASLGFTPEAVDLCRRLAVRGLPLHLCIDTAHALLNREDPIRAVEQAREFIREFHFCNSVTDPAHPLFGDRHLPFGAPGLVDVPQISRWMRALLKNGYLGSSPRPRVYCEVWKPDDMESIGVIAHCQDVLERAWSEVATTESL